MAGIHTYRGKIMYKIPVVSVTLAMFVLMSATEVFAKIDVISVKGTAAYKTGRIWTPMRPGMTLKQGAKISTGVRSTAVLRMNGHRVSIKPLTMMKIYENSTTKKRVSTRIGLRRGSIRADVSRRKRIRTVFKVSTPVATSSVRGTSESISYGLKKGMIIVVIKGLVEGESRTGLKKLLSGKLVFQQKPGQSSPDPLLSNVKNRAMVFVYDNNITDDEQKGHQYYGGDLIGGDPQGPQGILDQIIGSETLSGVNVNVQWPELPDLPD